ncbi:hypothetical protein [Streptomyces sp. NPDC088789]|uniref:hypothetical protein n=1 Tax=Streptomyces sp. NPDC088789 TaxID=3365899 RepID=UPI0038159202
MLGGLWTMECSYVRPITLAEETGPLLSHHRPAPADVAPVRSVLTLMTAHLLLGFGPVASLAGGAWSGFMPQSVRGPGFGAASPRFQWWREGEGG